MRMDRWKVMTLKKRILDFIDRKYDVLVCTNIVESGVDIPNVNTIIVNNAHQFGLSDLHQLRGRVGRSNKKAFCYLLAPPMSTLPADSRKRFKPWNNTVTLEAVFRSRCVILIFAEREICWVESRAALWQRLVLKCTRKILDEAIRELKRTAFKELFKEEIARQDDFVQDCTIDTDLEILIPDEYVESITERLSLYTRLDNCESEEELLRMEQELIDQLWAHPFAG